MLWTKWLLLALSKTQLTCVQCAVLHCSESQIVSKRTIAMSCSCKESQMLHYTAIAEICVLTVCVFFLAQFAVFCLQSAVQSITYFGLSTAQCAEYCSTLLCAGYNSVHTGKWDCTLAGVRLLSAIRAKQGVHCTEYCNAQYISIALLSVIWAKPSIVQCCTSLHCTEC